MKYKYGIDSRQNPILIRVDESGLRENLDGSGVWGEWSGWFIELPLDEILEELIDSENEHVNDDISFLKKVMFYKGVLECA